MASYEKVIERWLALERGERPGKGRNLWNWRMPAHRGRIDSYGSHFTLAETVRDGKGRIRCFLLNGDRSTVTTMGKHQPAVRKALQASGIQCIIVPFSALNAARIERHTIRPIAVNDDWTETIYDKVKSIELEQIVWDDIAVDTEKSASTQFGHLVGRPELNIKRDLRAWSYSENRMIAIENPATRIYQDGWNVEYDAEHGWHVKHWKHWLGESVFRARVGSAWRTFVSSFDYQELPALYFLAEIPRGAKPRTVEEAILALSPRIVHAAVAQGREVKRQGDMFAIPTALTTRDLKKRYGCPIERMQGVFGTDHVVTEQIVGAKGVTYARGTMHHRPGFRADHKRVKLGMEWHLVVPNTVPRRRGAMIRVPR